MQISRHWRINAQRYQLTGNRTNHSDLSIQQRPSSLTTRPVNYVATLNTNQYPQTSISVEAES